MSQENRQKMKKHREEYMNEYKKRKQKYME